VNLILDIPVLEGRLVRSEPLAWTHATDLANAAEEDRSTFGYTWVPRRSEVEQYIARQLQQAESGKLIPLTQIRLADNRAVGCAAYWDPRGVAWASRQAMCGRDRLDMAGSLSSGHWTQHRGQAPPFETCFRAPGRCPGRYQDRCQERSLSAGYRKAGGTLRRRLTPVVTVLGSR
jgi:hypothetical protein